MVTLIHCLRPIISPKKSLKVALGFPSMICSVMWPIETLRKLLGSLKKSPTPTFNIKSRQNVNVENHDIGLYIVKDTQ